MSEINEISIEALTLSKRFHSELPDVPGKSASEMKEFFDYIPKSVIIPKINELINFLKEKDLSEKKNQKVLEEVIEGIKSELKDKVEIPDYEGLKPRDDNDVLCLHDQNMCLDKSAANVLKYDEDTGLLIPIPAREFLKENVPCNIYSESEIIELAESENTTEIPLFAIVDSEGYSNGWGEEIPGYDMPEGMIAKVILRKRPDDNWYISAFLNQNERFWLLDEFINGEVDVLNLLEDTGYNTDSLYVYFDELQFYSNFLNSYISKLITESDLRKAVYSKYKVKKLLQLKADSQNVYTKAETDELLKKKANAEEVYEKVDVDGFLVKKADVEDVYDKTEASNLFSNSYIGEESGSVIRVYDISPEQKKINISLSSDEVTDFSLVDVMALGKNHFRYPYKDTSKEVNGINFVDNGDGSISLSGTATATALFDFATNSAAYPYTHIVKGLEYTISCKTTKKISNISVTANKIEDGVATAWLSCFIGNKKSEIFPKTAKENRVRAYVSVAAGTVIDEPITIYPMLEIGSTPSEFESFVEPINLIPSQDGKLEADVIRPNMVIIAKDKTVTVNARYSKDINKVIDEMRQAIINLGGTLNV